VTCRIVERTAPSQKPYQFLSKDCQVCIKSLYLISNAGGTEHEFLTPVVCEGAPDNIRLDHEGKHILVGMGTKCFQPFSLLHFVSQT